MGGWFVGAARGFVTPASFSATEPVTYTQIDGLNFEGNFATFSRVAIGRLVGAGAVRALCLTFSSGFLVSPVFSELDPKDLLHVPVLSIKEISRAAD